MGKRDKGELTTFFKDNNFVKRELLSWRISQPLAFLLIPMLPTGVTYMNARHASHA